MLLALFPSNENAKCLPFVYRSYAYSIHKICSVEIFDEFPFHSERSVLPMACVLYVCLPASCIQIYRIYYHMHLHIIYMLGGVYEGVWCKRSHKSHVRPPSHREKQMCLVCCYYFVYCACIAQIPNQAHQHKSQSSLNI